MSQEPEVVSIPSLDFFPFLESLAAKFVAVYPTAHGWTQDVIGFLIGLSFPISVLFVILIIYCVESLKKIRNREEEIYDTPVVQVVAEAEPSSEDRELAERWRSVTNHVEGPDQNDWKQAIMEADIMLGTLLTKIGYRGESIGEQLKRVEPGDMETLNEAWEAHKLRNAIAHEPGFSLSQHEARRAINLYRKVFEEFYYI